MMVMPMNILPVTTPTNSSSSSRRGKRSFTFFFSNPLIDSLCLRVSSSSQKPQQNDDAKDDNSSSNSNGDQFTTDWNKAWSSFKKQSAKKRKTSFSPNKYVDWNPKTSNYPLSEEVDPIKRTEKSNLMLWTSPRFTLFGAIVVVSLLLLYTILAPIK